MCENGHWEPFQVVEKEGNEPLHRCYLRCTVAKCTDIRVKMFDEDSVTIDMTDNMFNDPSIEEIDK